MGVRKHACAFVCLCAWSDGINNSLWGPVGSCSEQETGADMAAWCTRRLKWDETTWPPEEPINYSKSPASAQRLSEHLAAAHQARNASFRQAPHQIHPTCDVCAHEMMARALGAAVGWLLPILLCEKTNMFVVKAKYWQLTGGFAAGLNSRIIVELALRSQAR